MAEDNKLATGAPPQNNSPDEIVNQNVGDEITDPDHPDFLPF